MTATEQPRTLAPEALQTLRDDFPLLTQTVNGKPLVYLDNGATTQKPRCVIDAINTYYAQQNANVHRGAHTLSDQATGLFEQAREDVARFINAPSHEQIVWTRGTTESINLVAASFGASQLKAGDRVLISAMEHHANIVPWQQICLQTGAELCVIPVLDNGELSLDAFDELLDERVKLLAIVHVSNALGSVNPVADMITKAHGVGAKVLVDGAQAVAHWPIDVQALDVDFYVFSGHKLFGPTGIGVLYGKAELLDAMPPYQSGGEMIEHVTFGRTTFQKAPFKFEAGTPNMAGAIGLGAAVRYLAKQDRAALLAHEQSLLNYAHSKAEQYDDISIIGHAAHKAGIFGFTLDGTHPSDVGLLLDQQGIAVRTGNHCAMPIMAQLSPSGSVRASLSIYNSQSEIDALFTGLDKARSFLC